MSQIQSDLLIGQLIELKTFFPISIDGHNIEYQKEEGDKYVYTGAISEEISKGVIYQIKLDSYLGGNLATIKVSLKEKNESVVQVSGNPITPINIASLTTNKPINTDDGG